MVGTKRFATIAKSRIDAFPAFTDINLDFTTFQKLYGASVIDEEVAPITLATKEQLDEIKRLVEVMKISEEDIDKALAKRQATDLEDLSKEGATDLLVGLNKKLKGE